jgi:heme/copper-type cytochrome/quinol oxidase subunit 2
VRQRLLALLLLAAMVLWIVLSYLPTRRLPVLAFSGASGVLAALAVAALLAFIAIQLWLIRSTMSSVSRSQHGPAQPPFRLKLGVELFWTALPLVITLALAWAGYARWVQLIQP